MNVNEHFATIARDAAGKDASTSEVLTQRRQLFSKFIVPNLTKKGATDEQIRNAQLDWNTQTDKVMQNYGLLAKDGQSQRSFEKDKRGERAVQESVRTGSKFPVIKETLHSVADTIGNSFGQGSGSMIESVARFSNDKFNDNEKGTYLDRAADYGADTRKGYEKSASTYQKEVQAGEHGKAAQLGAGAIQSMPAMAMPFGAAKLVGGVASKVPFIASKAPYFGLGAGVIAGHTQNYGEVRRGSTQALERDFPTWESLQGNEEYKKHYIGALDQGLSVDQARKSAHAKTLDDLSENAADKYGTAMTAMEFIAPSGAFLGSGLAKNGGSSTISRILSGGVDSRLVTNQLNGSAARFGISQLFDGATNKAMGKMVGKQFLEEGLQGGIGEYGSQAASANIGGQAVDYKKVGQSFIDEGIMGAVMGGGMQSASGATPVHQAKEIANQIRNQTNTLRSEEVKARQELAKALQFNNQEDIESAKSNIANIQQAAVEIKQKYTDYGVEVPHFINTLSNDHAKANRPEVGTSERERNMQQNHFNETYRPNDAHDPVIDINAIDPDPYSQFRQATPNPVIDMGAFGEQAAPPKPSLTDIVSNHIQPNNESDLFDFGMGFNQQEPAQPSDTSSLSSFDSIDPKQVTESNSYNSNTAINTTTINGQEITDTAPAIRRFPNQTQAKNYLKENNLKSTHKITETPNGAFLVEPIQEPEAAQAPIDLGMQHDPEQGIIDEQPASVKDQIDKAFKDLSSGVSDAALDQVAEHIKNGRDVTFTKPESIESAVNNGNYNTQQNEDGSLSVLGVRDSSGQWVGASPVVDTLGLNDEAAAPQEQRGLDSLPVEQAIENNEGDKVNESPTAQLSFADKIRDAHVNNPSIKTKLINDEIAAGRPRHEVLQEVSQAINSAPKAQPITQPNKVEQIETPQIEPISQPIADIEPEQAKTFSREAKANEHIRTNNLTETHETVKNNDGLFEIQQKKPKGNNPDDDATAGKDPEPAPKQPQPPKDQKTSKNGEPKNSDVGRASDGQPFANKPAANTALKKQGLSDSHEVTQVAPSQFVLREKIQNDTKTAHTDATNDRDSFSLERGIADGSLRTDTFKRGEKIKIFLNAKNPSIVTITGISHANGEFKYNGGKNSIPFGYAYKLDFDHLKRHKDELETKVSAFEKSKVSNPNRHEILKPFQGIEGMENDVELARNRLITATIYQEEAYRISEAKRIEKDKKDIESNKEKERIAKEEARKNKPEFIELTMEEWKKTHKDQKSIDQGQRYVMRFVNGIGSTMIPVKIVKLDQAKETTQEPTKEPNPEINEPLESKDQPKTYESIKESFDSFSDRLTKGDESLKVDDIKQVYQDFLGQYEDVLAEFSKMTKQQLLDQMHPYYQQRYKSENKPRIAQVLVDNLYRKMSFNTGGVISFSFGDKRTMAQLVGDNLKDATQEQLDQYLDTQRKENDEYLKEREAAKAGLKDPKTLDDFARISRGGKFKQFKDFYHSLTLPQQALYDELKSQELNEIRLNEVERQKAAKEANRQSYAVEGNADATLFAGKHTKHGTDIWTVSLNGRVEGDAFNSYRDQAKNLGGYYSSYRGGGAIAGFVFKDESQANEFLNQISNDPEINQDTIEQENDVESLPVDPQAETEITETDADRQAEKLKEKAQTIINRGEEDINRDRKSNTTKRAREASRAEEQANHQIFLGETLMRISEGIRDGSIKYLNKIGATTQLRSLESLLQRASHDQQRETKAKDREVTANTIPYVEFPQYKTWIDHFGSVLKDLRSIKPSLAKRLDDAIATTQKNAYKKWLLETNEFNTANYEKVTASLTTGGKAIFKSSIDKANTLVKKLNAKVESDTPKFEVYKIKNGEYAVIASSQEAIKSEVWKPNRNDQMMTLTNDFGHEIMESLKSHQRKNPKYYINWQMEAMQSEVSRMEKLGIHDPATFRAAMREYLGLRSKEKGIDPIKAMERSMIGRSNDGLDFFPTPRNVVEQMIELAQLSPDMKVLEPSAGMGHIADILREYGVDPDVIELSGKRQDLLKLKGYRTVGNDFLMFNPDDRSPNYGDTFKTNDGKFQGTMHGAGGLGSSRVLLKDENGKFLTYANRDDLELVKMNGGKYDRIMMNPPFGDRRDAEHIYHAFDMLNDDGVLVAIAGEGVFTSSDKKAKEFQEWLNQTGAEITELDAGTFNDPNLPVTTGVKARIITIHKSNSDGKRFSRNEDLTKSNDQIQGSTIAEVEQALNDRFGKETINKLKQQGTLDIVDSYEVEGVEGVAENGKVTLIAGNLKADSIIPTFLHEVGGHLGFQGLLSEAAYSNLMQDFNRLVQQNDPIALKAKELAERESDSQTIQDEYLPYLITEAAKAQAKTSPAKKLVNRILNAVKAWVAKKLGVTLNLTANDILKLSERMIEQVASNPVKKPVGKEILQKSGMARKFYNDDVVGLWSALTQDDDAFQLGISTKKDLAEIFKDLEGDAMHPVESPESSAKYADADRMWRVKMPSKGTAVIMQREESVWVDVSMLKRGGDGKRIYNAVANYAYNNDLVFIGDPVGLSDTAMTRRLENMISSALKFGTTKHLYPQESQSQGNAAVPAIQWKIGDDLHNIKQMITASYEATKKLYPEIETITYNPTKDIFEGVESGRFKYIGNEQGTTSGTGGKNREFTRQDFYELARISRELPLKLSSEFTPSSGSSTIERAILTHTFLQGKSRAVRLNLLDRFSNLGSKRLTGVDAVLYSQQENSIFKDNFSYTDKEMLRIAKDIDRLFETLQSHPQPVQFKMPPVLLALDGIRSDLSVKDFPLQLDRQTLRKITGHVDGKKDINHQMSLDQLKKLPSELADPLIVLHSDKKDGFVIVTSMKDGAGNTIISAIHLNKNKGRYVINELATTFGKDNFQNWLSKRLDNVIYSKNEKSQEILRQSQLQKQNNVSLGVVQNISTSSERILTQADIVNNPPSNSTKRYSRVDPANPQDQPRSRQREFFERATQSAVGQAALGTLEGSKTLSNRTVKLFNTMMHKALSDETGDFKKTFDLVQDKINHVTFASSVSMEAAPSVLTQLETWGDFVREGKRVSKQITGRKSKIDTDLAKVSQLMFENTLTENSEAHTAKELRQLGFDEDQIGLYNEVRDAVDTSLDTFAKTTISNIYKHLAGTNEEVLELIGQDMELHQHASEIQKLIDQKTKNDPNKADARKLAIESIDSVMDKLQSLKDAGYIPLMRFGKYFIRVVNPTTGEVAYRQHFESESERNMFFNNYNKDNIQVGYTLEQGQINELQHKLFQGVSPETVALFAKEANLPIGDAESAYIKMAVRDNHALKRLLQRQGIEGFDTDIKRVLASFVLSNARYSANQTYNPAIDESIQNIKDPAYAEDAIRLRDYALDTQEELAGIKNFAFVWYMGFSVMFGVVNMTQPIIQTLPYLLQYSKDWTVTAKAFTKALKTWKNGAESIPDKYKDIYNQAKRQGHLDPQNTWMLQGMERGKSGLGANGWQLFSHASGFFAQASETINRRTTLFAALDVAEELGQAKLEQLGFKDAYDFAVRTIQETQGIYNKGNRPRLARGNVGSMLMMYKQFMIAYIEQMVRMQKRGLWGGEDDEFKRKMAKLVGFGISKPLLIMMGLLMSFSGATGLPFVRDLLDVIETTGGMVGKPFNTEREVQVALNSALGDTIGVAANTALMDGVFNLNPVVDLKGRMGMGDLVPATAYFSPLTSEYGKNNEGNQAFGAMGGLTDKIKESIAFAQVGQYGQASIQLLPKALTSIGQGGIAAITGDYRNMKTGVKTNDASVFDGVVKALDGQPADIAKQGRYRGLEMKDSAALEYVNKNWKERYKDALETGDKDKIQGIRNDIKEYNADDPRYPITFKEKNVEKKLKKDNQTWQEKRKVRQGLEWMNEQNPYI